MGVNAFFWNKVRRIAFIPGFYKLYTIVRRIVFRNNRVYRICFGPLAGLRWKYYQIHQPWMVIGMYEPQFAAMLKSKIKEGEVFYDLGANAGYYTLLAAMVAGKNGKVYAFEPLNENCKTIEEQCTLNSFKNVEIIQKAVSNQTGPQEITIPDLNANTYLASLDPVHVRNRTSEKKIIIECITLDSFISNHSWPGILKMDIEGAEVLALEGAKELLRHDKKPVWFVTAHSVVLHEQVMKIFRENNYRTEVRDGTIIAQ